MIRLLFKLALTLILIVVLVGVGAYLVGYWQGDRRTGAAIGMPDIESSRVREMGADIAEKAQDAGIRVAETVEDGALTAKIKSKMALDDYVKARGIDVDTSDGIVTLSGTVQSEAERERALRLARETEGAKKVVDALAVGPAS